MTTHVTTAVRRVLVAAAAVLVVACSPVARSDTPKADLAFVDVRVFDGEQVIEDATVLVHDDEIVAAGTEVEVPDGTDRQIAGDGRTLLPGLIDAHTHTFGRDVLERVLAFGVTTQLDMFTVEPIAAQMRREQRAGDADDRADLYSSGVLATAPGGHGTQFGVGIPTLDGPQDAASWVADRVDAGADYIKVVIEEGYDELGRLPTLDAPTVEAIVDEAHDRGLLVITHVHSRAAARTAVTAGTDGLAHMFHDEAPGDALVELMAARDVFVIPTSPVFEYIGEPEPPATTLADDPELAPYLTAADRRSLATPYTGLDAVDIDVAQRGISRLHEAGVAIAAGSDAPNPGTAHGASLHRELELLTESGLSPTDALESATAVPADIFGLEDRGRIAVGRRADLLLVDGDPTTDILATRAIAGVWKAGVRVDRRALRTGGR